MNGYGGMEPVAIVVALALIEYLFFVYQTGRARLRCGVPAPKTVGHEEFERHYRVQQNTLEQLIVFLPAIWIAGWYADVYAAAILGLGFVLGRAMYYRAYVNDPAARGPGFALGLAANAVLVITALVGAIAALLPG
jgi:glutathione S-transferase